MFLHSGYHQRHKSKRLLTGGKFSSAQNCEDPRFANTPHAPEKNGGFLTLPYIFSIPLVSRVPGMEQLTATSGEFPWCQRPGVLLGLSGSWFFNGKRSQAGISRVC